MRLLAGVFAALLVCGTVVLGGTAPVAQSVSVTRSLDQAIAYYERSEFAAALEEVELGLNASPLYIPLWLLKGKIHIAMNQYEKAYEAVSVVISAEPGNVESAVMALQILLEWPDLPEQTRRSRLTALINDVGEQHFASALARGVLRRPNFTLILDRIIPAWKGGPSSKLVVDILNNYSEENYLEAGKLLDSPKAEQLDKEFAGALNFLIARGLAVDGEYDRALKRLKKAQTLGYDRAETDFYIGLCLAAQNKPLKAAEAWESSWRLSPTPAKTAMDIIDALMLGGEMERALTFINEALGAFPAMPGLQGRKMLALDVLGQTRELTKFALELSTSGQTPGISYGQALIARKNGEFRAYNNELVAVRDALAETTGQYLELNELESWLRSGGGVQILAEASDGQIMISLGEDLWGRGKIIDALIVWDEALRRGVVRSPRVFVLGIVERMFDLEMHRQGLMFLNRHIPEMTKLDLVASMARRNRWGAVNEILKTMTPQEITANPWLTLFQAQATVRNAGPEEVAEAAQEFFSRSTDPKDFPLWDIDDNGMLVGGKLTETDYRDMVADLGNRLIQDGHSGSYREMLVSPYWSSGNQLNRAIRTLMRTGQSDAARQFLDAALLSNPDDPQANFYMALLSERQGKVQDAKKFVFAGLRKAEGAIRDGLLAIEARLNDDKETELVHLLAYIQKEPDDLDIRLETIRALVASHRYAEASNLQDYLIDMNRRPDTFVSSHLALSLLELGEYDKAEEIWRWLVNRYPESARQMAGLGTTLNYLGKPAETISILEEMAKKTGDAELTALIAEASMAISDYDGALEWVERGLAERPEDLRLLSVGAIASEAQEDYCEVIRYTDRYLAINPTSVAMHGMYGQALVNLKRWPEVYKHNRALLKTNPRNMAAMEREFERLVACAGAEDIWQMDCTIAETYGNEPAQIIRAAVSAASAGEFHYAFDTLECIMSMGQNTPILTLYVGRISLGQHMGAVQVSQLTELLDFLEEWYCYTTLDAISRRQYSGKIPLILVIGRSDPKALEEMDRYLGANGGHAVLAIGEESLSEKTPIWADVELLRKFSRHGRWEFLLTDYNVTRYPGAFEEETTSFYTQKRWLEDRKETCQEMNKRITKELARLKNKAQAAGIEIGGWVHPDWGDYGQRVIVSEQEEVMAYRQAVADNFGLAYTQTSDGFWIPGTDCFRLPMRAVGSGQDACELMIRLKERHPTRRAILELAKVKSWHDQFPAAEALFNRARGYGLNRGEIAYFQGRNSYYQGDVPSAIDHALEALQDDPTSERARELYNDAKRLMRPLWTLEPRYWTDSDDQSYYEVVNTASFHLTKRLALSARVGLHQWKDEEGRVNGTSVGVGARYYFYPGNFLEGEVRGFAVDNGAKDYVEFHGRWHGIYNLSPFNYRFNGTFDLEYHHEGIETRKAQLAGIMADRFQINTNSRINNWWDVDANAYYVTRDDGNDTWGVLFRPTYRIKDIPQLRIGYWFAMADSDRNPDEYYAPVDYMAHQAVAIYRHSLTEKLSINALAAAGMAKSGDDDWRFVWRVNAGFSYQISQCIQLSGGVQYLKLPDYTLRSFSMSLGVRF